MKYNYEKGFRLPKIIVTIPVMDEDGYIQSCIQSIKDQTYKNFHVISCVNQPDHWWKEYGKRDICENNLKAIEYLKDLDCPAVEVIDRSSPGRGFSPHEKGVGHARNLLFKKAIAQANNNDLVMCLDADTIFEPGYFQSVVNSFLKKPNIVAHANPYYHNLTGDDSIDRAILRYEIYMRLYVINLWNIGSPYAFTPLGSAITIKVNSLKKIGKLAPKPAGEDFYLLQKLRKHGNINQYNDYYVFPSSRVSNRVPFGTGPAVGEGIKNKWNRYPIYPLKPFKLIKETYDLFPVLFRKDIPTPLDSFFEKIFGTKNIFEKLRQNCRSEENFIRACHMKFDGLRILQFVKYYHLQNVTNDEDNLQQHIKYYFGDCEESDIKYFTLPFEFNNISISLLQKLRNLLADKELLYRKKDII